MATILDITHYLIQISHQVGKPTDPLQIQKLLYYAQGISLAKHDRPLFTDKIKAWCEGPVLPVVWHHLRDFGRGSVPCPTDSKVALTIDERVFLRQIYALYGKYSGDELSEMTHKESPWLIARGDLPPEVKSDAEITQWSLQNHFRSVSIDLPDVPRPVELRKGREVFAIEDADKVLPAEF